MPTSLTPPRNLFRTDLLGWLCFLTLLIANVSNRSAPAHPDNFPAANQGDARGADGLPCTSDIAPPGGDGQVDVLDLLAIISDWGPCVKDPPPPVCDPNGQWLSDTGMSYTCALGTFHYNLAGWEFFQSGNMLFVDTVGFGSFTMTGPATDCEPGNSFTVTGSEPGNCTVTATLSGTFTTENQFTGTFTVSFSGGNCFDCFTQNYNIIATR